MRFCACALDAWRLPENLSYVMHSHFSSILQETGVALYTWATEIQAPCLDPDQVEFYKILRDEAKDALPRPSVAE